jgi:soluble lytic murein transglycosylase-like protein
MKSILRYSAYVAVAAALLAQPAWASWQRHQDWQDGGYQPRHHVWRQARHHLRSQPRQYVWYQPQRQPWYQLQEPAWYQRWRDTAYQPQRDLGYQPRRHVWHHAPREHHYAWHYRQPSHRQVEHAAVASAGHHAGLDDMIAKHAAANNLPLALVHRVIKRESDYNPRCIYAGNYGLMQIRLGTARSLGYTGTIEGLLDPDTNMTYAVRYLAGAYRVAGGNEDRAVALYARGYNSNDVTARRSPTFATLWSRLASRW